MLFLIIVMDAHSEIYPKRPYVRGNLAHCQDVKWTTHPNSIGKSNATIGNLELLCVYARTLGCRTLVPLDQINIRPRCVQFDRSVRMLTLRADTIQLSSQQSMIQDVLSGSSGYNS